MRPSHPPLGRSIGLAGVVWWLVAVVGTVAVGAALAERQYTMALAGIAVIVAAMAIGCRVRCANAADASSKARPRIGRWSVIALVFLCDLSACMRPAVRSGVNISSERSDYSPTARIAVAWTPAHVADDTIHIVIDSGSLSAPGVPPGDTAVTMRDVYLRALLVGPAGDGGKAGGLSAPWDALAQSDSIKIVAGLRGGEVGAFGLVRLRIPRPSAFNPRKSWLVFRITGVAVPRIAHRADRQAETIAASDLAFRVYACADWNLSGRTDRARARLMRGSYLAAC